MEDFPKGIDSKEYERILEEPNWNKFPSSFHGIFFGLKSSQWGGVIQIVFETKMDLGVESTNIKIGKVQIYGHGVI